MYSRAMRDHSGMSEIRPVQGTIAARPDSRHRCARDSMVLICVLYGIVHATRTLAGDQSPHSAVASMFPAAFTSMKPLSDVQVFSATEFRPRQPSFVGVDTARGSRSVLDAPMPQNGSIFQHMSEYKSGDRLRLLTLWQTGGSSLSLQAGKRGSPSLQWSTPWVHREGAARGLFDRLLISPARSSSGSQRSNTPRPAAAAPAKPAELGPSK
jgi:hypothetical protein